MFIKQQKLNAIKLGYEEFCLSFEKANEFLVSKYPLSGEGELGMNMHNVFGNVLRQKKIQYDYRWMTDDSWKVPALLIPGLLKKNKLFVYSNNFLGWDFHAKR